MNCVHKSLKLLNDEKCKLWLFVCINIFLSVSFLSIKQSSSCVEPIKFQLYHYSTRAYIFCFMLYTQYRVYCLYTAIGFRLKKKKNAFSNISIKDIKMIFFNLFCFFTDWSIVISKDSI